MLQSNSRKTPKKSGDPSFDFLIDFTRFCDEELFHGAPAEIRRAVAQGLRVPKNDDDLMVAALRLLALELPEELLERELLDPALRHPSSLKHRATLASIIVHPGWRRLHMLNQLADRVGSFKAKHPEDWMHWMYLVFDLLALVVRRNFADVQALLAGQKFPVTFKEVIADDKTLLDRATHTYREKLFAWKNETERTPFSKQDLWMALLQEREIDEGVLISVSDLIELRARHVMENYGLCLRDARIVVATTEMLGKVIDPSADEPAIPV